MSRSANQNSSQIVWTDRMLFSLLPKNLPQIMMLIATTRKPVSASISKTVNTISYRGYSCQRSLTNLCLLRPMSWLAARLFNLTEKKKSHTCAKMSFIASLTCSSPFPSRRSNRKMLQERIRNSWDVVFRAVTYGGDEWIRFRTRSGTA